MNMRLTFQVGELYSNDQIRFSLQVGNLGGIRPSLEADGQVKHIAVFSSVGNEGQDRLYNPYQDRVEGDVLIYTAAGREGDQQLQGVNKRITEQYVSSVPILGFGGRGRQLYEFLGLLALVRHYQESQLDSKGNLRLVWVFEFRVHKEVGTVPIELLREMSRALLEASRKQRSEDTPDLDASLGAVEGEQHLVQQMPKLEEIRAKLLAISPYRFEHVVKAVLQRNGFEAVEVTRASGDGGVDISAVAGRSNRFFTGTLVQLQAKRWRHAVGSVEINNFRGALSSVAKGIFVTTSHYTRAAIENANHPMKPCITLMNGPLFSLLIDDSKLDLESFA